MKILKVLVATLYMIQTNGNLVPETSASMEANPYGLWPLITPLLGDISPACRDASLQYVEALSHNITDNTWALQMLDSNGRLPQQGFLSDSLTISINLCTILNSLSPEFDCDAVLVGGAKYVEITIPVGHSVSIGNYDGCMDAKSDSFEGRYCLMYLVPGGGLPAGRQADRVSSAAGQTELRHSWAARTNKILASRTAGQQQNVGDLQEFVDGLLSQVDFKTAADNSNFPLGRVLEAGGQVEGIVDRLQAVCPDCLAGNEASLSSSLPVLLLLVWTAANLLSTGMPPAVGGCYPSACSPEDVNATFAALSSLNAVQNVSVGVYVAHCDDREARSRYTTENYVIFAAFGLLGLLLLAGTLVDAWDVYFDAADRSVLLKDDSLGRKLLKSFSVYTNTTSLLSTRAGGEGHLGCLNGMRFISMTWVVLGHSFSSWFGMPTNNPQYMMSVIMGANGLAFDAILNGLPSVDTFFFLSGTLVAYITFQQVAKIQEAGQHAVALVLYYVHRYIRLTIPYAFIMAVAVGVFPLFVDGPFDSNFVQVEACRQAWWRHFLYINTVEEMDYCMGVTWYLCNDMIYYWLSPLVIYPMLLLTRRHAGLVWWCAVMLGATAVQFGLTLHYRLTPSIMFDTDPQVTAELGTDYDYPVQYYFTPWARVQPYLVGLLLGYVLFKTKGQKVEMATLVKIALWQVAFLAAFSVVYGLHNVIVTRHVSLEESLAYNTLQRVAWSSALAWVVFACVKGHGGPVNDFLSWPGFAPLSRLTYCCYLIHIEFVGSFGYMTRSPIEYAMWNMTFYFLANLALSLFAAFVFSLAFEMPFAKVEKLLVGKLVAEKKNK